MGHAAPLALAPAFGPAVGAPVLTTLSFVVPLRHSLRFAVRPPAALSAVVALRNDFLSSSGLGRRELGALLMVVVWGLGVFSLPMLARQSYGSMGYGVW